MNSIPSGYVETKKGVYVRRDLIPKPILQPENTSRNRKPKPPVCHGALGEAERKTPYTGRIHVRVTVRRKRTTDPDNNTPKYVLDCLRYAQVLPDDREQDITLETRQEKTRDKEETLIELFRYDAKAI